MEDSKNEEITLNKLLFYCGMAGCLSVGFVMGSFFERFCVSHGQESPPVLAQKETTPPLPVKEEPKEEPKVEKVILEVAHMPTAEEAEQHERVLASLQIIQERERLLRYQPVLFPSFLDHTMDSPFVANPGPIFSLRRRLRVHITH